MRLVRGAGTRGLAGIYPQLALITYPGSRFSVLRRFYCSAFARYQEEELEAYLGEVGQEWREDSTNRDLRHARNRVRHGILPRLERNLNPAVREALAETAEIARAEEEYWKNEIARVLPLVWEDGQLTTAVLAEFPLAVQRRVVRAAAESLGFRLEFRHVEEILQVSSGNSKSATLPEAGWHREIGTRYGSNLPSRQKSRLRLPPSDTGTDRRSGSGYTLRGGVSSESSRAGV